MDDLDKVYERVLEIQKNIEISDTQQQGLIMNELIKYADTNKINLKLSVDSDNIHALHLYEKYNFFKYKTIGSITYMEREFQSKE
jgi:hypothetical protein